MAARWISLSSGNPNPRAFANAAWLNGLSALMASSAAPRALISCAASPRPPSSGVQMLPQS
jgi:hypothetical protein